MKQSEIIIYLLHEYIYEIESWSSNGRRCCN